MAGSKCAGAAPAKASNCSTARRSTVDDWIGVIADGRGVEALAGIMGGEATAVTLDTADIYLEAAFWWPESIQGRARRYNFSTDAAHRFERGTDYATTAGTSSNT